MDTLIQDIRYGLRTLRKTPLVTVVAVLSLALGIGANTAIFTVINAVFFHPIPVSEPKQIVNVFTTDARNKGGFNNFLPVSKLNYDDYRANSHAFSGLVAEQGTPVNLSSGGEPRQVFAQIVTGNYWDVLGVKPAMGRGFSAEEDRDAGTNPVVVLSDGLWKRRFGADPHIVGQSVMINGVGFTVIGIAPEGFQGTAVLGGPDLWVPMAMHDQILTGVVKGFYNSRRFLGWGVFGRLKPGSTEAQAQAELKTIAAQLEQQYPVDNKGRSVVTVPLLESLINPGFRGFFVQAGALMMGVVGMVLLIACANIANLLLARSVGRRREISIRVALGASRGRLLTQLLTESLLLSVAGGALGLALAIWGRDVLWAHRPPFFNGFNNIALQLDARVLLFTFALAVLTGLLFGLAPALQASSPQLALELKERAGSAVGAQRKISLRNALVVAEVVLSLVAVIAAGLFLVSLRNAQRIDPGMDAEHLAVLSWDTGAQGYSDARSEQFYQQVMQQVSALPGVRGATVATALPLFNGGFGRTVFPEGEDRNSNRAGILAQISAVAPNYLQTVGMPLLQGRNFTEDDRADTQKVAIVNQEFAHRFWPGQEALGKRFKFFDQPDYTQIVGIVRDGKYNTLGEDPVPYVYRPLRQDPSPALTLFVRTQGDAAAVLPSVRGQVQQLEPQMALTNVSAYHEIIDQALWAAQMSAVLLGIFASLALVLAAIGIYGVTAYSVSQRTREIGIRMALGARPGDVLRLVLKQGMGAVGAGVIVGMITAWIITRQIAGLLYNVKTNDPTVFVALGALLIAIAMFANWVPARRAARVDPVIALRYE